MLVLGSYKALVMIVELGCPTNREFEIFVPKEAVAWQCCVFFQASFHNSLKDTVKFEEHRSSRDRAEVTKTHASSGSINCSFSSSPKFEFSRI